MPRAQVRHAAGERIDQVGMLGFGVEEGVGRLVEVPVLDQRGV